MTPERNIDWLSLTTALVDYSLLTIKPFWVCQWVYCWLILKIVSNFKNKQSCGYNGIHMPSVKLLISSTNIVQPLTYICNKSFESGVFPDQMKIAKICLYLRIVIVMNFSIIDLCQFCPNLKQFLKNNSYQISIIGKKEQCYVQKS